MASRKQHIESARSISGTSYGKNKCKRIWHRSVPQEQEALEAFLDLKNKIDFLTQNPEFFEIIQEVYSESNYNIP